MSDYTPTTEEVEAGYAYNEWDTDAEEEEAPRREAFRRWLGHVKAEAYDEALSTAVSQIDEAQSMWLEGLQNPYREADDDEQL